MSRLVVLEINICLVQRTHPVGAKPRHHPLFARGGKEGLG